MDTIINALNKDIQNTSKINITELEKQITTQLQMVILSLDYLPILEAKSLLKTIISKVILKGEKELEICLDFH